MRNVRCGDSSVGQAAKTAHSRFRNDPRFAKTHADLRRNTETNWRIERHARGKMARIRLGNLHPILVPGWGEPYTNAASERRDRRQSIGQMTKLSAYRFCHVAYRTPHLDTLKQRVQTL